MTQSNLQPWSGNSGLCIQISAWEQLLMLELCILNMFFFHYRKRKQNPNHLEVWGITPGGINQHLNKRMKPGCSCPAFGIIIMGNVQLIYRDVLWWSALRYCLHESSSWAEHLVPSKQLPASTFLRLNHKVTRKRQDQMRARTKCTEDFDMSPPSAKEVWAWRFGW